MAAYAQQTLAPHQPKQPTQPKAPTSTHTAYAAPAPTVSSLAGPSGAGSAYSAAAPPSGGTAPSAPSGTPVQPNGQLMPYAPTPQPAAPPTTGPGSIGGGARGVVADMPGAQYQVPNAWAGNDAQMQMLMGLFNNPLSMSDQVVSQMKGMNRDSAMTMAQQAGDMGRQTVAGRGLSLAGQQGQQAMYNPNQEAIRNILQGNRQIDIAKAQQDRQDIMGVLGAGNDVLGGQQQRQLSANEFALQRALGLGNLGLGWGGIDMDGQRLGESARQFNMGNQLNWAGLMNDMTMGRANYGLNLAQLQQGGQNNMFNYLMGGGR